MFFKLKDLNIPTLLANGMLVKRWLSAGVVQVNCGFFDCFIIANIASCYLLRLFRSLAFFLPCSAVLSTSTPVPQGIDHVWYQNIHKAKLVLAEPRCPQEHCQGQRSCLSTPKPGNTTCGSGRSGTARGTGAVEGWSGQVGAGMVERKRIGLHRTQLSSFLFAASSTTVEKKCLEARTKKSRCKPMGEQNERLTCAFLWDHCHSSVLAAVEHNEKLFVTVSFRCVLRNNATKISRAMFPLIRKSGCNHKARISRSPANACFFPKTVPRICLLERSSAQSITL